MREMSYENVRDGTISLVYQNMRLPNESAVAFGRGLDLAPFVSEQLLLKFYKGLIDGRHQFKMS